MIEAPYQDRRAEKFIDGAWCPVPFEGLRKGDVFRVFEPDGTPVDEGLSARALTDAVRDEHGVWGLQCVHLPGLIDGDRLNPKQAERFLELVAKQSAMLDLVTLRCVVCGQKLVDEPGEDGRITGHFDDCPKHDHDLLPRHERERIWRETHPADED